jgi:glycosyltransferase involved in cell wall biosynthesis
VRDPARPLSITEVLVRFWPYVGGVENTAYELSRRLVARGHRVQVVCSDEAPAQPAEVEGVRVRRLPWIAKVGNANVCPRLWREARRARGDIYHTHLPTALFPDAAGAAAHAHGVPLVISYNTDLVVPGKELLGRAYHRLVLARTLRRAARIVVPNPECLRFSRYLQPLSDRVTTIPWGVDLDRFRPSQTPPGPPLVVGFLSLLDRHHVYKGLEDLLRGAALAVARGADLHLRIGGAGDDLERYRALAAQLGLGERAELLGFVPDDSLASFFAGLHVFALPSRHSLQEGFGLVALEAMAAGRAVLTTPIAAIAVELREREAGIVVPVESPGSIAEALSAAAGGSLPLAAMAERARQLVEERYGWEAVTHRYETLFRELAPS